MFSSPNTSMVHAPIFMKPLGIFIAPETNAPPIDSVTPTSLSKGMPFDCVLISPPVPSTSSSKTNGFSISLVLTSVSSKVLSFLPIPSLPNKVLLSQSSKFLYPSGSVSSFSFLQAAMPSFSTKFTSRRALSTSEKLSAMSLLFLIVFSFSSICSSKVKVFLIASLISLSASKSLSSFINFRGSNPNGIYPPNLLKFLLRTIHYKEQRIVLVLRKLFYL